MKKYELLLVLPGTLDDKEAETRAQEILAMVKENSTSNEFNVLGKNRLAYPVKQIRYGYFYTIVFEAETAQLKIVQEKLGLMRDLLRAEISIFNTNLTTTQKINYTTNSIGVTTMAPEEPVVKKEEVKDEDLSLKDINKKLDEILDGSIISGV